MTPMWAWAEGFLDHDEFDGCSGWPRGRAATRGGGDTGRVSPTPGGVVIQTVPAPASAPSGNVCPVDDGA